MDLPWEWYDGYRLRSTVYVWYLALPLKVLRYFDMDYPILIRNAAYTMQFALVIIGDLYFFRLARKHVGVIGGYYSFFFYVFSSTNSISLYRTLGNSVESILSIIALFYFTEPLPKKRNGILPSLNTAKYISLISISFMIRNTSPLGWLPLLFYRLIY